MTLKIFGIRHHGQGSAKSLLKSLEAFSPDCILIEGPTDANEIIHFISNDSIKPPVAILIYLPEMPQKSVIYPFAVFSPEWQAMKYAYKENIPVRFIDLPQYYQLKKDDSIKIFPEVDDIEENDINNHSNETLLEDKSNNKSDPHQELINSEILEKDYKKDPITIFANLAGYDDVEVWWDNFVENRKDDTDIFEALDIMVSGLRDNEITETISLHDLQRESYMRQSIRKAIKEGFKNIAVICGAWHIPALKIENYKEKEDKQILSKLKKESVKSTWIPWTYNRLSYYSGYGAGIQSPNWYEHIWESKEDLSIRWIIKAANLFRKNDIDVSSAHIIETVRLAETLSLLRDRNSVGLLELQEAIKSVICFGNTTKLDLIKEDLVIGNKMGEISSDVPLTPLQADFNLHLKKFRLKKEIEKKEIDLDLRKENDLEKSYFFHRLNILNITWAKNINYKNKKGTFHEYWETQWIESDEINIIEAGIWGNTIEEASSGFVVNKAEEINDIYKLVEILFNTLFSNIPDALNKIILKIKSEAALSHDIEKMMKSVSVFVKLLRYGDVRKTDALQVQEILDGIISRICIGLNVICTNINIEAAQDILKDIISVNDAIKLLQNSEYNSIWLKTIQQMSKDYKINKLIAGYCDRLILDNNLTDIESLSKKMFYELSPGKDISESSYWLEGFLKGSALILINNEILLSLIDNWLINIPSELFLEILPILRRNFSDFTNSEKRQIGEAISFKKRDNNTRYFIDNKEHFSIERAERVIPVLKLLMGIR